MSEISNEELNDKLVEKISDEQPEVDEEVAEQATEVSVDLLDQMRDDVSIEPEELGYNIYQYLEYDVKPESARSTVLRNVASREGVEVPELLEGGGGQGETQKVKISEIDEPDQFVTLEAKVERLWDNDTDSISQVGVLEDETGTIKFKTWEKSQKPLLTPEEVYRLEGVATDEWQDDLEVSINSQTNIEMIDKEIDTSNSVFSGVAVGVNEGNGLIRRCTEEGCSRVLNDGECQEHGDVEGDFDLRLKLVLDNGQDTETVVLNRELTEKVTGIRLEEAREMAKQALDTSVVESEMVDEVLHNYYRAEGWENEEYDQLIAEDVELSEQDHDVSSLVERLNALQARTDNEQQDLTEVN